MIHNLLPKEYVKQRVKEYRLRLFVLFSILLLILSVIRFISLFPSYLYVSVVSANLDQEYSSLEGELNLSEHKELENRLSENMKIISTFNEFNRESYFSNILKTFSQTISSGISIKSINIIPIISEKEKGSSSKKTNSNDSENSQNSKEELNNQKDFSIKIAGNSKTREGLVEFKRNLEMKQNIPNVSLPVSDLAKSSDINFTISFELKIN